ncbi:MAG: N-acetylmuramidase domain-containing protein [Alsobacter sp.]
MSDFHGAARKRTDNGIAKAAAKIGCEEAALRAVVEVEARGSGFDAQGRPKALFEPHRFYALLSGAKRARAVKQGLAYVKWGTKPYSRNSYDRIIAACAIDGEAALKATSWGLGQIMGENYRAAGFTSVQAMVTAFQASEDAQLMGMAAFIKSKGLDSALKALDWRTFAKGYNGAGYAKNAYHSKLARAYQTSAPVQVRGLLDMAQGDDDQPADDAAVVNGPDITSGADAVDEAFGNPPTQPDPPEEPPLAQEEVKALQLRLQKLNYAMVGKADGAYGPNTVAAVAAFQHEHDLTVTGHLDAATKAALWAEQKPRVLSEARAQASVQEVAERVPAVKANWLSKIWAGILAGVASLWSFIQGIADSFPSAQDMLGNVKGVLGDIPPWTYGILVAGAAAAIFWFSHKSEKEAVKDFRTGRTS